MWKLPLFGCSPTAYSIYCIGSWKSFVGGSDKQCSRRRVLLYRLGGAGRNTASHASPKATKNKPPHLSGVRKRHSAASGGATVVAGTYWTSDLTDRTSSFLWHWKRLWRKCKNRHLQTEYPKFIAVFFSLYMRMTGCCMMLGNDHFLRHYFHFFLHQPYLIWCHISWFSDVIVK
jgi:hypothetical protein